MPTSVSSSMVRARAALREMYFYQSGKQAERFNRTRYALRHLLIEPLAGDVQGAISDANNAKLWSWISFGLGLAGAVGYLGLGMMGALADGTY